MVSSLTASLTVRLFPEFPARCTALLPVEVVVAEVGLQVPLTLLRETVHALRYSVLKAHGLEAGRWARLFLKDIGWSTRCGRYNNTWINNNTNETSLFLLCAYSN